MYSNVMKLQKQLSRKVGTTSYDKWVVVIPNEKIKEAGWNEGIELDIDIKGDKMTIKRSKVTRS